MRLITAAKEGSELFYFYVMPQATEQNVGCKDSGEFANYLSLTYNLPDNLPLKKKLVIR